MSLVFSLWRELMETNISKEDKLNALCALLQVYSALLGITEEDFYDLSHQVGETYTGPLPDQVSEEVISYYAESSSHDQ